MNSKHLYSVALFLLFICPEVFSQIPTNGLVAHYPFNGGSLTDVSGNGNNGTNYGATLTADRLGNPNSAYYFDGSSYIEAPSASSLNFNTQSMSITAWIKLGSPNTTFNGIVSKMSGNGNGYQLALTNNQLRCEFGDSIPRGVAHMGNQSLYDTAWHNVVWTIDRSTNQSKYYVDNILDTAVFSANLFLANVDNNATLKIGVERLMQFYFNGSLDDIAIYNRVITQQEINQIYLGLTLSNSDTTICISSTTGTDSNGWDYADFVIPAGYKIDSVYGDFVRNGYPTSQHDFIFEYCPDTPTYTIGSSTFPFNYQTVNTSLYQTWIDLTSFNYRATGMIRVRLPTNAGAVWNNLCLALSQSCNVLPTVSFSLPVFINNTASQITLNGSPSGGSYSGVGGLSGNTLNPSQAGLGNKQITYSYTDGNGCGNTASASTIVYDTTGVICTSYDTITTRDTVTTYFSVADTLIINAQLTGVNPPNNINTLKLYPNPASDHLVIDCGNITQMTGYTIKITNSIGQVMFQTAVTQQVFNINLSGWAGSGIYVFTLTDAQQTVIETKQIVLQ